MLSAAAEYTNYANGIKMNPSNPEAETPPPRDVGETRVEEASEKTADRPHHLTWTAAFGALTVSFVGLIVSIQAWRTSATNLHLTQRAFLVTDIELASPTVKVGAGSTTGAAEVDLAIIIQNTGNTDALRVRCSDLTVSLDGVDLNGGRFDSSYRNPCGLTDIGPRQKDVLPFPITLTDPQVQTWRERGLQIDGTISYRDVFDCDHNQHWSLIVNSAGSIHYSRQYTSASTCRTWPW